MKKDSKSKWCPLKEGPAVVGKIWPAWDAEERFGNLITTLWSRVVPMRSRFAIIQGRYPDLRDALLDGRRKGPPWWQFPGVIPGVERLFRMFDARCVTVDTIPHRDIPTGLIILAGTIIADDYDLAQFFPGVDNVIGRELTIVLTAVEFDRAAAETYVVENLLPSDASRSDQVVAQSTNRRGPSPDLRTRIEERMATDIENDAITVEALRGMKQEALAARYDTKRYTAVQARKNVLGKTPSR